MRMFLNMTWRNLGFPINVDPSHKFNQKVVKNHSGATEFPAAINEYIETEIAYGSLMGPFDAKSVVMLASGPIFLSTLE